MVPHDVSLGVLVLGNVQLLNRFLIAGTVWLMCTLILAAEIKSWIGFPLGAILSYSWLYWVSRSPTAHPQWRWKNLRQPINTLLVGGVIGLHVGIQVFLTYIGLDLIFHLVVLFSVAPIHIATVLISVLEKPPKSDHAQIVRRRKKSWY